MRLRVGLAEASLHGQDRALIDLELGLFGVFDGIGEFQESGQAASLAADTIDAVCREAKDAPLDVLVRGCEDANKAITAGVMGSTTATVAWIIGQRLHYVSVGDSRLYRQRASGRLVQVTWDEGEGNMVDNYVGHRYPRFRMPVATQKGTLRLKPGDKCLLVTDGITGDFPPDLLRPAELRAAIVGDDPQQAAENLIRIARKEDDRTAVVIFVG
ncbi:MAG: PP2C family protein-serine/threonine phosphatase [Candidatus Dormibacteria bacterium]